MSSERSSYTHEKEVAIFAVKRACELTSAAFKEFASIKTAFKDDKSPVTVADYAAQAVVNTILGAAFPQDGIVGEEDAHDLTREENDMTLKKVVELANQVLQNPRTTSDADLDQWGVGTIYPENQLINAINRGDDEGGSNKRFWTLDPIDGTKGFRRGEQYAVCLALIENSIVKLGVIGCPNLPVDASKPDGEKGCLFVAVREQGAYQQSLKETEPTESAEPTTPKQNLHIPSTPAPHTIRFLESVEAAHSSHGFNYQVARALEKTTPPNTLLEPLRMDSQAKYCSLARGDGNVYLRMPTGKDYVEKIWDHAAGQVLVEEAGGIITDSRGHPLNFGLGKFLTKPGENYGIVGAGKGVHEAVIEAIRKVKAEEVEQGKL